jgi:hypothetical protein
VSSSKYQTIEPSVKQPVEKQDSSVEKVFKLPFNLNVESSLSDKNNKQEISDNKEDKKNPVKKTMVDPSTLSRANVVAPSRHDISFKLSSHKASAKDESKLPSHAHMVSDRYDSKFDTKIVTPKPNEKNESKISSSVNINKPHAMPVDDEDSSDSSLRSGIFVDEQVYQNNFTADFESPPSGYKNTTGSKHNDVQLPSSKMVGSKLYEKKFDVLLDKEDDSRGTDFGLPSGVKVKGQKS